MTNSTDTAAETRIGRAGGLFPLAVLNGLISALKHNASVAVAVSVFFLLWQVSTVAFSIPAFLLPAPVDIFARIGSDWLMFLYNGWVTLQEILLGFGLSVIIGIGLAVGVVSSPTVEKIVMPFVISLKTIPKVALAPILIIWLGYGLAPKVAIAFLISFFPILISSIVGLRSVDRELIQLARSMGASTRQIFLKFRFPNALPSIFGGLRIGIVQAAIGAVVAEYLAAEAGLGYLQVVAQSRVDTEMVFASVICLSVLGVLLFKAVVITEKRLMPWSKSDGDNAF